MNAVLSGPMLVVSPYPGSLGPCYRASWTALYNCRQKAVEERDPSLLVVEKHLSVYGLHVFNDIHAFYWWARIQWQRLQLLDCEIL